MLGGGSVTNSRGASPTCRPAALRSMTRGVAARRGMYAAVPRSNRDVTWDLEL